MAALADNIRGLTVEIAADATKFKSEMKNLRSEAKSSQSELNALQKSLELKFDGEKFARAQEVARQALDKNAEAAELLRERLAYLEQSGNIDTSEYRKLQTELAQTELKGQQLQAQLQKINNIKYTALANQVKGVGNAITGVGQALTPVSALAAGAVAGVGALGVKAISTADEIATLATQYEMSAEALQRFNYVALQTDTDATTLYKALQILPRVLHRRQRRRCKPSTSILPPSTARRSNFTLSWTRLPLWRTRRKWWLLQTTFSATNSQIICCL